MQTPPSASAEGGSFDIDSWITERNLDPAREAVWRRALIAPPERIIRPGILNTTARHPSDTTDETNHVESGLELAIAMLLDANDRVPYWVAQPAIRLKISYRDCTGKKVTIFISPDFAIVERAATGDVLVFLEAKPETVLARMTAEAPERVQFEDGRYRSRPAEAAAAAITAQYRFVSSADVSRVVVNNGVLFRDYRGGSGSVPADVIAAIRATVAAEPAITLRQITRIHAADHVLPLIADGVIYGDLTREPFYLDGRGRLFLSAGIAAAYPRQRAPIDLVDSTRALIAEEGRRVMWEGNPFQIVAVGDDRIVLQNEESGTTAALPRSEFERLAASESLAPSETSTTDDWVRAERERRMKAPPDAWARADKRRATLEAAGAGRPVSHSRRTLTRWRQRFSWAERYLGWGLLGLIDEPNLGNTSNHGDPARASLIGDKVKAIFETADGATTILHVLGEVIKACEEAGFDPPTYETVRQAVHRRVVADQVRARDGDKAGNAEKGPSLAVSALRAHGSRGFEKAEVDHTQLEIEIVDLDTGINLGRPWLTLIIDADSRAILGLSVSFAKPSRRSVFRALRDCVRRHRRLPEMLVVDGGAEFRSAAFETFCAAFRIAIQWRAASNPRFGALIESLLGGFTRSILRALRGNTKATRNVRTMTQKTNPRVRAVWDLVAFLRFVNRWVDEVYHLRPHPAHHMPPIVRLRTAAKWSGQRVMRIVADSEAFRIATLPEVDRGGTRRIHHRRGVKVDGVQYHHTAFETGDVSGTTATVKQDPEDVRFVYVLVRGAWLRAETPTFHDLGELTDEELVAASIEFDRLVTTTGQARPKTAAALAEILRDARKYERVRLARMQASAERRAIADGRVNARTPAPDGAGAHLFRADEAEEEADLVPLFEESA